MPTYEVFFKREYDGRAGDSVWLDLDYVWVGEQEATSIKDLARTIATTKQEESKLEQHRPLRTGDVLRIKGEGTRAWVLTPVGIWAQVMAFEST